MTIPLPSGNGPVRLFSLWDLMNVFNVSELASKAADLASYEQRFASGSLEDRLVFMELLRKTVFDFQQKGMIGVAKKLAAIIDAVKLADPPNANAFSVEARHAKEEIIGYLQQRKFLRVALGKGKYVDRNDLLGVDVSLAFRSAIPDIREAGNCLAAECHTAAVFHFMRVSEHGLRAVARRLNVKLVHKGYPQQVDYADWNKVITGIKNKIAHIRTKPVGPKQDRDLTFYSDVAEQCEYMKDIWRNTISHARRSYNEGEAEGVMIRVQDFMRRLARGPE